MPALDDSECEYEGTADTRKKDEGVNVMHCERAVGPGHARCTSALAVNVAAEITRAFGAMVRSCRIGVQRQV